MSKLSYKLRADMKVGLFLKIYRQLIDFFMDLWHNYPHAWINNIKFIFRNLKLLRSHIIHMRDWDSYYQINLFCDSLAYLAKGLKRYDNHVRTEKTYRRCLFAAQRLKQAYDYNYSDDKSYDSLVKNNPVKFVDLGNGDCRMGHDYSSKGEDYYNKMFGIIQKRQEKAAKRRKKEAWDYINKYIESFWD